MAGGMGTWGFKGAPIFGVAAAQEIATGRVHPLVAPFSPGRFAIEDGPRRGLGGDPLSLRRSSRRRPPRTVDLWSPSMSVAQEAGPLPWVRHRSTPEER
jgi:hypothetical protein